MGALQYEPGPEDSAYGSIERMLGQTERVVG